MALFRRRFRRPKRRLGHSTSRWTMRRNRTWQLKVLQLVKARGFAFLVILTALSTLTYTLTMSSLLQIKAVEVTSSFQDINTDKIQESLQEMIIGKHLWTASLLDNGFEDLQTQFPDISELNCDRQLIGVKVECDAEGYELIAVMKHQGKRYYINENGVVIPYDQRKLGLPLFELVLNPVYAGLSPEEIQAIEEQVAAQQASAEENSFQNPDNTLSFETVPEPNSNPQPENLRLQLNPESDFDLPVEESSENTEVETDFEIASSPVADSFSDSQQDLPASLDLNTGAEVSISTELLEQYDAGFEVKSLRFLSPLEGPPPEPIIQNRGSEIFVIAVGKQILDPEELEGILTALRKMEEVVGRKVIEAQYVQVAGELSLKSRPAPQEELPQEPCEEGEECPQPIQTFEDAEHEITVLLDLRRDVDQQLRKLRKMQEVVNFQEISRIDLSIDGEKVFYR